MRRLLLAGVAALVLTAFSGMGASASDDGQRARVFQPHSSLFGQSYREWAVDWFRWVAGTPTPTNPFLHPDNCGPGPNPHAWFLAGATGGNQTAHCTVPEGKGLLVSPVGNFCAGATHGVFTRRALIRCAFKDIETVTGASLKIDGRRVPHINRFFIVSRKFPFRIPADNIFGLPAQTTPAVVIGDFIMIRPLEAGRHSVVAFVGSPVFPGGIARITFHLRVVADDD
ncbi:MAG: hypothetical protein QOF68_1424 [Gaiellales bacterium]|nr:hypothetical protein [Gaiellales bacterium]